MTECWADTPQVELEPICYTNCFIKSLINNIKNDANGKIYSIISLTEIFDKSHNGGKYFKNNFKHKISRKRLHRNKRLSVKRCFKGGDIYRQQFDPIDRIYAAVDTGFKSTHNYYYEYLEPSINVNQRQLSELETKFKNPLSTVVFENRTAPPKFIRKLDLYRSDRNRTIFNDRQITVPNGKLPIKSYTTKPTDLDNKILFFENETPMKAFVRKEIVDAVAFCENYMQTHDDKIPVNIYLNFPIYFNISMPSSTHMVTIIKINASYYSFGFAFTDTSKTFSQLSDRTHVWDRLGSIFSPDSLFKLKPDEEMRLVDFGILRQSHIENLNSYLSQITGIYADYTESINLNADNTLSDDTDGKIVLKNLQFITNKSRYFSFGSKPLSSDISNNCASFTSKIFEDRINCVCPFKKRLSLFIDNHPENCYAARKDPTNKRCQKLHNLLNTRVRDISVSKFKQIMNFT